MLHEIFFSFTIDFVTSTHKEKEMLELEYKYENTNLHMNDIYLLRDCLKSLGMEGVAKTVYSDFSGKYINKYARMIERIALDRSRLDIIDDLFFAGLIQA